MREEEEVIIEPSGRLTGYARDLWRFRELFYFLAWRDILVRYKQTLIGGAWALIRPFLTMVVFTLLFSRIVRLPSPGGVPYPLIVFAAMLPWQFLSSALSESSGSVVGNANLISKVYFPRLIVPATSLVTSFVDFSLTLAMMTLMMVWYQYVPDWHLTALPLFAAIAFAIALGAGLWLSALNAKYRDVRYIVPFIVQFGLYVSPVGFSSAIIPEAWRKLYAFNPMVGVIEGFRWALLRGTAPLDTWSVGASIVTALVLMTSGIWYFRQIEHTFADVI